MKPERIAELRMIAARLMDYDSCNDDDIDVAARVLGEACEEIRMLRLACEQARSCIRSMAIERGEDPTMLFEYRTLVELVGDE